MLSWGKRTRDCMNSALCYVYACKVPPANCISHLYCLALWGVCSYPLGTVVRYSCFGLPLSFKKTAWPQTNKICHEGNYHLYEILKMYFTPLVPCLSCPVLFLSLNLAFYFLEESPGNRSSGLTPRPPVSLSKTCQKLCFLPIWAPMNTTITGNSRYEEKPKSVSFSVWMIYCFMNFFE